MLFKVTSRLRGRDTSSVPSRLPAPPTLKPASASKVRDLVLIENASALDNPIEGLISSTGRSGHRNPRAGSTEIWRIINTTGDAHPIHVHLVQFRILDRQPFDLDCTPNLVLPDHESSLPRNERQRAEGHGPGVPGRGDADHREVRLAAGTRVNRGQVRYVLHCHILEHEDNDMMRPYDVVG